MAPNGRPGCTNIWANDFHIVEREVSPAMVGDSEHVVWQRTGDDGAGWETLQIVKKQRRRNGMAEQEGGNRANWHNVPREHPVIGHQEGDIGLDS